MIHALDPHFADVLANLEKLSDGDVGRAVVRRQRPAGGWSSFTHDRDPGATYLYDHDTGESRLLFRPYPHLRSGAAGADAARDDPVARRSGPALLPDAAGRSRAAEPAAGADGARRAVGARRVDVHARRAVAGQPRIRGAAGQLPRIHRIRQGVRQGRDRRVRGQDARRPDRRGELGRRAGLRRPRPRRDLRRLLRRLRDAGRRDVHTGRVRRGDRLRRHLEPGQLHAHTARDRAAAPGQQLAPVRRKSRRAQSSWRTCWPARRSRRSTRSAHRCW